MKFSKAQIAALVLGYLKSEKLYSVVDEFIKCCSYLKENNENIKFGKYFVTRVSGMTLVDFLEQYSVMYTIVQGRLEETNFYDLYKSRTSLVEQLVYLLDLDNFQQPTISTPETNNVSSEVDATPAHTLPGNSTSFVESDHSIPKTPKKRSLRTKSKDKEEIIDMTEVLTQSLLEHHELHEKIAETINIVRNTPEVVKTTVSTDEHISAGASKEIDAVIKTVIQRTEEDPVYNKLIDEIIGTTNVENQPTKKPLPLTASTPTSSLHLEEPTKPQEPLEEPNKNQAITSNCDLPPDPIDDHNNAAIRSIIEVSQNTDPPPTNPDKPSQKPETNGEVYVFDGSLDTYLKTSGATTSINPNPVYLNPGGLILMPPAEPTQNQYYIVNNQPMLKMNVYSENDIMSLPTIIVNDEAPSIAPPVSNQTIPTKQPRRPRAIKSKLPEPTRIRTKITEPLTVITEPEAIIAPKVTESTRQASHVRNLDFSTPAGKDSTKPNKKNSKAWDSDLRQLVSTCKDKSPSPKRKKTSSKKKKSKKSNKGDEVIEEEPEDEDDNKIEVEEREKELMTPVKDRPKTPGLPETSGFHCTPFNAMLEEQLQGVDLTSIPTPSIPITPGFALTPGDMLGNNQRLTDYSTSSSYYQPSDSEQNKTMGQLLQECEEFQIKSPIKENTKNLKILSNVIIEKAKQPEEKKVTNERLSKFHNNIIGKKNLSLIKRHSSLSSSETESESEKTETNKTVIYNKKQNTNTIKDIINEVEVKPTLDKETLKRNLLSELEQKRQRTVSKIKKSETEKKTKTTKKKNTKKKDNKDREAEKLVKGLAQRGIHLIPNKKPEPEPEPEDHNPIIFDTKTYEDVIVTVRDEKIKRKPLKSYDFTVLKKSMSAKVFIDDLNQEVTRIMRWTNCDCLLDSKKILENDELMDFSIVGNLKDESNKEIKSNKKRKKVSEEGIKQKEKKNKTLDPAKLLNDDDAVEAFLDKIHPE